MIGDVKNLAALSPSGPAKALNADMQPAPFQYDFGKMKSTDILAEEQKLIPQLAKAESDLKTAEMTYQENLAGEKAKATEKFASDIRDKVTETQKKESEFPFPEFHPTQENAQSLGELFSLVSTVGLMLGSSGKMASMNALNAMSGMLQGWQKGRADLYKKQKDEFDKEFQRIKTIRESIRKDLMDYMAVAPYDKEAAMYKAEEIARKAGGSSIITAYMNKQQPEMALKILDSAGKIIQHKEDMEFKKIQEQRRLEHERSIEKARIRQAEAAERRAIAAEKRIGGGVSDRFGFGDIVATASNEAAASLKNLVQMPSDVTSGIFGGRRTTSLFTAPLDTLVNTAVTSEDTQRYNTEINNLGKFIAQVQKGGRVVTNADIETTSQAFRIEEGDKPLTKLTKLAQARQALERALEVRIASPNTPEQLKQVYRQNQDDIRVAVPFTVSDVNKFANERDKNKTFTDSFTTDSVSKQTSPSGPKEGDKEKSKSGKPMVFRNGQWEYE